MGAGSQCVTHIFRLMKISDRDHLHPGARIAACARHPARVFRSGSRKIPSCRWGDGSAKLSDGQPTRATEKLVDDGADSDDVRVFEEFVANELTWSDGHPGSYSAASRARGLLTA